jgi:hypothetical protein
MATLLGPTAAIRPRLSNVCIWPKCEVPTGYEIVCC